MTTTPTETGAAPAPMGLVSRFIGVITSPKATFENVAAYPKWLGMLALTSVILAACVTLPMTTPEGKEAAFQRQISQMESFGMQVNDQMYAQMQQRSQSNIGAISAGVGILIVGPIMTAIIAGVLFGVFTMLGGQATYKQVFAVYVHSAVIGTLAQMFTGPLNYFRGSVSSATNLAVALPMIDEKSFLGHLFGMIDLFWIWGLIVTAIGLATLYRRRTAPIAYTFFGIYAAIILAVAGVMAALGR
jgi:hypothetical protein